MWLGEHYSEVWIGKVEKSSCLNFYLFIEQ